MTKTETNAVRDLQERAVWIRAAADQERDKSRQMRLAVGAVMLDQTAAFIAARASQPLRDAHACDERQEGREQQS